MKCWFCTQATFLVNNLKITSEKDVCHMTPYETDHQIFLDRPQCSDTLRVNILIEKKSKCVLNFCQYVNSS